MLQVLLPLLCGVLFVWLLAAENVRDTPLMPLALSGGFLFCLHIVAGLMCRSEEASVVVMKLTFAVLLLTIGALVLLARRFSLVHMPKGGLAAYLSVHVLALYALTVCDARYVGPLGRIMGGGLPYLVLEPAAFSIYCGFLLTLDLLLIPVLAFFAPRASWTGCTRPILLRSGLLAPAVAAAFYGMTGSLFLMPPALLAAAGAFCRMLNQEGAASSEQEMKDMFLQTLEDAVLITDEKGRLRYRNTAADALLREAADATEIFRRQNGGFPLGGRWYRRRLFSLPGAVPDTGSVIRITDDTEMHRLQEDLKALRHEAELTGRVRGSVLANMTHEIKTPMNVIIGMSEVALQKDMGDDLRHNLTVIEHAGQMLLGIVNHVLNLSKIESGNMVLCQQEYHLDNVLYDVSMIAAASLYGRPVQYQVYVGTDVPNGLIGDAVRLKEILGNLLGNAVKYTESGKIVLTVHGKPQGESVRLIFSVSDTGIGIPEEELHNIFMPYRQAHTAHGPAVEGVGLGLTIVKQLTEMMGGSVSVRSECGRGSAFVVEIPQKIFDRRPTERKELTADAEPRDAEAPQLLFPGGRILIVDDLDVNRQVAKGLLTPYQVRVDMAVSGREAVEKIRTNRYDLVLMDYRMLDLNGEQAVQAIRRIKGGCRLPVIALTADPDNPSAFQEMGFTDVLDKPVQREQMECLLARFLPHQVRLETAGFGAPQAALQMDGVDMALGLRQCGGKTEDYERVLRTYLRETHRILRELPTDAEQDMAQFGVKIHGLRGTSRVIGALDLGDCAERLEQLAKQGQQTQVRRELPEFIRETRTLLSRLERALPKGAPRSGEDAAGPDHAWWLEMRAAVHAYDLQKAEQMLRTITAQPCGTAAEETLQRLRELLDGIEYEDAMQLIDTQLREPPDA